MRDFRNAKAMAHTLRAALAAKSIKITVAESLELTAKSLGAADWNTLAAAIKAEAKPATEKTATSPAAGFRPAVPWAGELATTFGRASAAAKKRDHRFTTLEHCLLALIDDPDARAVLLAAGVDLASLGAAVARYVDEDLRVLADVAALKASMPDDRKAELDSIEASHSWPGPTAGLSRAATRATDFARVTGRPTVTGEQMLAAIVLSAGDCQAAGFLAASGMTRQAALGLVGGAH